MRPTTAHLPPSPASAAAPVRAEGFLKLVDVEKTYDGETLVVKNLSLALRQAEFLTLLGPSGSGKTTTLLMLAGFEQPTRGEIWLDGRLLTREPAYKRDLGMVFQDYALFPHMTVVQNVAFPLEVRKRPRREIAERVAAILEMVKLRGFEDRLPAQLSGGQQQRVALARALVFEPRVVLMDEPLGALDKQLREQMQLEIKHIQRNLGVTVVYVTHDQSEALTMSDRIAVFNDGQVSQLDTPAELYEHPQSSFVAQFIGENNRLHGKVLELRGGLCEVALDVGGQATALAVKVAAAGERTVLSIRPERVVINPDARCRNRFQARVEEVIYLGDHVRLRVRLSDEVADFVVKVPISQREETLHVDLPITIGWPVEHCRALDAPR